MAPNYALNLPKTEGKSDILYINIEKGNLKISLKPDHKNEIVRWRSYFIIKIKTDHPNNEFIASG